MHSEKQKKRVETDSISRKNNVNKDFQKEMESTSDIYVGQLSPYGRDPKQHPCVMTIFTETNNDGRNAAGQAPGTSPNFASYSFRKELRQISRWLPCGI
jgi:hypothetical protein